MSNLINNAFEVLPNGEGKILVKIRLHEQDRIYITVEDPGKGIPLKVFSQIGVGGASFNEESGRGLGLFHARLTICDWSERLRINSEVDIGTKISIDLVRTKEPIWFVPKIKILNKQTVIIDDEQRIHEYETSVLIIYLYLSMGLK
ncbi:ATP-binding protein [Fluviispira sanaruensis]|uniref:Histidine kinase domain-containing protein n=1 Tax=Fluviispira sanaruensis TaxID=2493639 RepID=A0A4V0P213_FLUSA|nr:ATP-binding protein [Fluviispira sanaruensis]BBH51627.1 hypothetical protein JCM31447_00440 [Fluviispira sanaruensis]